MKKTPKRLSIKEAQDAFGVSKRTLERRIASGGIFPDHISTINNIRYIDFDALVSAFGEPKAGSVPDYKEKEPDPAPPPAKEAKPDTGQAGGPNAELVALLKEQLQKAEEREKAERERAERLEIALAEARQRNDEIVNGLVLTLHNQNKLIEHKPPKRGILGFFGRFTKKGDDE